MSKTKSSMACNFQGAPDAKKPCKGILKTSSSFDKHTFASNRKSAKFDELNVLQTYHPADKDYGHMKIEEPKTPYRIAEGDDDNSLDQLDAELLAEKLRKVTSRSSVDDDDDDNDTTDEEETEDSKMKRLEFEKRRKAHYNEFEAVRRARQLMEEEDDDDDDNDSMEVDDNSAKQSTSSAAASTSIAAVDTHV